MTDDKQDMTTRRSVSRLTPPPLALPLSLPRGRLAQAFPSKPIKSSCRFRRGGPADHAVRIPQAAMEKALGQPIIVENVPGAGGQIGAQRVKARQARWLYAGAGREPARPTPRSSRRRM